MTDPTINEQIRDAVAQVQTTLAGSEHAVVTAALYQAIAHAITMALQNAVAQQQHGYILRNALTAAAANAILDGKREEAEAILRLAESRLLVPNIAEEVDALLAALGAVHNELSGWNGAVAPVELKDDSAVA
jgi:Killing trait